MFICTPFGIGVTDPAWYNHRLDLIAAITAPSLLAQEDQGFQWAVLVDPDLPTNVHQALTELLDPFEGRAFLHAGVGDRPASWHSHASVDSLTMAATCSPAESTTMTPGTGPPSASSESALRLGFTAAVSAPAWL